MIFEFILFGFVLSVNADWRIIGGQLARPGQFPYYVSLRDGGTHMCGAAIINENTVITAAHCFKYNLEPGTWKVVVGAPDVSLFSKVPSELIYQVKSIRTHRGYSPAKVGFNDIAILRVTKNFQFNEKVQKIRIAEKDEYPKIGDVCDVMGYGHTAPYDWDTSDFLLTTTMKIRKNEYCSKTYRRDVPDQNMCAGSGTYRGVCSGDSGGPLVCGANTNDPVLYGIASYTRTPCGQYNSPGVFTRAGYFMDWIKTVSSY